MKQCFLFLLVFNFAYNSLFAQAPFIRSQKSVTSNGASYEVDISGLNGGISTMIPKVHLKTRNGNTLVGGNNAKGFPSLWYGELNAGDSLLWSKTYNYQTYNGGNSYDAFLKSLQPAADSGYIIMGQRAAFFNPATSKSSDYAWVIRTGDKGDSVWQQFYGGSGYDVGNYICRVRDEGYIFIGNSTSFDGTLASARNADSSTGGRIWICRIDKMGNLLWSKCFGFPSGTLDKGVIIKPTSDGGFICGANMQSRGYANHLHHGDRDIWLAKLDSIGTIQWARYYGGSGTELLGDIEELTDGFAFVGSTSSMDGDVTGFHGDSSQFSDGWIVKLSNNGQINWQRCVGGSGSEYFTDVIQTYDNGFVAIGSTTSVDGDIISDKARSNIMLSKMSGEGTLIWNKVYGGSNLDYGRSVLQTGDNDYLILGTTWSVDGDMQGDNKDGKIWLAHLGRGNTIKGSAYYDDNSNGIKDANEKWAENIPVTAAKNNSVYASNLMREGRFSIEVDTGSYNTFLRLSSPYYASLPAAIESRFSSYFNIDSISFALQPIPGKQDLEINIIPVTPARPGFTASYRLFYKNVGTTILSSGDVSFKKDNRTTILSTSPIASSLNGDMLNWTYSNLKPGDTASIFINLRVNPPPSVNNGDILSFLAMINPVADDQTPANDTARLKQQVIGSYDPNDKAESNAGTVAPSFITNGEYLQYTVRFQNTGTDTAFNVVVRDTLSSKHDPSTIEMIAASHSYNLRIENDQFLAWNFDDILLVDSNRNEPASHGYIVYRIRPRSDVALGETIHSTSSIYFDYNLPVLTNDAPTTVEPPMIVLPQSLLSFFGNLQNDKVHLTWNTPSNSGIKNFTIERSSDGTRFTPLGLVNAVNDAKTYSFDNNIGSLSANRVWYRLKMTRENNNSIYSHVVFFTKRINGQESLLVTPNPVKAQSLISFNSQKSGRGELQVINASGIVMEQQKIEVVKGENVYPLTRPTTKGVYYVRILQADIIHSTVFAVQ